MAVASVGDIEMVAVANDGFQGHSQGHGHGKDHGYCHKATMNPDDTTCLAAAMCTM